MHLIISTLMLEPSSVTRKDEKSKRVFVDERIVVISQRVRKSRDSTIINSKVVIEMEITISMKIHAYREDPR